MNADDDGNSLSIQPSEDLIDKHRQLHPSPNAADLTSINNQNKSLPLLVSSDNENLSGISFDQILAVIKNDFQVSDLLFSLFISALLSYRRDTVLRPFPQSYYIREHEVESEQSETKNFDKLKSIASCVPSFTCFLSESSFQPTPEITELLHWVLNTKNFEIKTVSNDAFITIQRITGQTVPTANPTYIFEIVYGPDVEAKFANCETMFAYHGSRVENFHSILHNGLCRHMNKNSLFGEGTYLSSELSVCMPYGPTGSGWKKSIMGDKLSCFAVCQLICHPDVKCRTRSLKNRRSQITPAGNIYDDVPEKYYIVQNDELVRVKYLLVFADAVTGSSSSSPVVVPNHRLSRFLGWLSQHSFMAIMVSYLLLLLAVGLGNSRDFKKLLRKYF